MMPLLLNTPRRCVCLFDYFCQFLTPRDIASLASTCRPLRAYLATTRAWLAQWCPTRCAFEACLSQDARMLQRFAGDPTIIRALKHVAVTHVSTLDVACDALRHDAAQVQALHSLFRLYSTHEIHTSPETATPFMLFCCIYNIHTVLKGRYIKMLHETATTTTTKLCVTLQSVAFWNGSWDCYRLMAILAPRVPDGAPHTNVWNKVRVCTPQALQRLLKKARKNDVYAHYKGAEWCLTAVRCGDYNIYLEHVHHLITLARRTQTYHFFEFVFCDNDDIMLHWFRDVLTTTQQRDGFIKYLEERGGNKLSQRKLQRQRRLYARRYGQRLEVLLVIIVVCVIGLALLMIFYI